MLEVGEAVAREASKVTQGPWTSRDGFVAETAIKIDRMEAKVERLERHGEVVKGHVAELMENALQAVRLHSFAESLRNARELKIEELQRTIRELKGRIDQLEGPKSKFVGLTYKSFDGIDARLQRLDHLEAKLEGLYKAAMVCIGIVGGSVLATGAALAIRWVFA